MPFQAGYPMATENMQFWKNTCTDQSSRAMVNMESIFPMAIRIRKSLSMNNRNLITLFCFIRKAVLSGYKILIDTDYRSLSSSSLAASSPQWGHSGSLLLKASNLATAISRMGFASSGPPPMEGGRFALLTPSRK